LLRKRTAYQSHDAFHHRDFLSRLVSQAIANALATMGVARRPPIKRTKSSPAATMLGFNQSAKRGPVSRVAAFRLDRFETIEATAAKAITARNNVPAQTHAAIRP
jgi:hypothetical protein